MGQWFAWLSIIKMLAPLFFSAIKLKVEYQEEESWCLTEEGSRTGPGGLVAIHSEGEKQGLSFLMCRDGGGKLGSIWGGKQGNLSGTLI